ncbi:astacin [Teladorsagia circumcincta]|uniref:Metalloendopeptidase n=1 Tax=Teladorsagia circumcincta TaxID=45464 RepID=A0A2G9TWL7_TELCI|nr:astacin [Teladorsagia circumcincta]
MALNGDESLDRSGDEGANTCPRKLMENADKSFKRSVDEVEPRVFAVDEANEDSGIADALFQADIVLTSSSEEDGEEDEEDEEFVLGSPLITIGTAAHELAHALGFWHTHARHDRDKYITVYSQNINAYQSYIVNPQETFASEFVKQTEESNYNYDLPYDYGSIMQYRMTA